MRLQKTRLSSVLGIHEFQVHPSSESGSLHGPSPVGKSCLSRELSAPFCEAHDASAGRARNPPQTPVINLFQVRQMDANGTVKPEAQEAILPQGGRLLQQPKPRTSRMISGYEIVPELVNPMVRQAFPRVVALHTASIPESTTGSGSCHFPVPHRRELGNRLVRVSSDFGVLSV